MYELLCNERQFLSLCKVEFMIDEFLQWTGISRTKEESVDHRSHSGVQLVIMKIVSEYAGGANLNCTHYLASRISL